MGALNYDKTDAITSEGLRALFQGFGSGARVTSGGENEIFIMHAGTFALPSDATHRALTNPFRDGNSGVSYSDEPGGHMLEVKNDTPYLLEDLRQAPQDIRRQLSILAAAMEERGLRRSPFSCTAFSTPEACLDNVIGPRGHGDDYSDRPRTVQAAFKIHLAPEAISYPVTNDCIHWTTIARDEQDLLVKARLQAAMTPFFFIYTENRPPYQNDSAERVQEHTGLRARMNLGVRGMYPDFLFAAQNGADFTARTIQRILETPMMSYFDARAGERPVLKATPRGQLLYPTAMQGLGREDISQFLHGTSQFWYNYKIKPVQEGTLLERRDFDEAPEVFQDVMLICAMIDHDDAARDALIEALETEYGIPLFSDPEHADGVIRANLDAAVRRGSSGLNGSSRFVHSPFGAVDRQKTVHDFLNNTLLPMMEEFHRRPESGMSDLLGSWRYKAEYGMTNAQYWNNEFNSMAEQRGAIRELTEERDYHARFSRGESWPQQLEERRESAAVPSQTYVTTVPPMDQPTL